MTTDPVRPVRAKASPWPFAGMVGMACVFFLYAASVLFLAWWLVALLVLLWVALLVVACAWWTPRPGRVPWVPVVAALVWVALVLSVA